MAERLCKLASDWIKKVGEDEEEAAFSTWLNFACDEEINTRMSEHFATEGYIERAERSIVDALTEIYLITSRHSVSIGNARSSSRAMLIESPSKWTLLQHVSISDDWSDACLRDADENERERYMIIVSPARVSRVCMSLHQCRYCTMHGQLLSFIYS